MFVTRRRLNMTIEAYRSEVEIYKVAAEKAKAERDLYKRELEAIDSRLDKVLPKTQVQTWTTA